MCGGSFSVQVIWEDGEDLARVFGGKLVPELVNALLGRLFLHFWCGWWWTFVYNGVCSRVWSSGVDNVKIRYLRSHCGLTGLQRDNYWRTEVWDRMESEPLPSGES